MPRAPLRRCTSPGCRKLATAGRCADHPRRQFTSAPVEKTADRGYGGAWQRARQGYLARHPLCVLCQARGRIVAATVVDHIIPHRRDWVLFWDHANWQALCKACHDDKTRAEIRSRRSS